MDLIDKIKQVIINANEKGINLPMIKDPKTKIGSVTVTLVVVSAGLSTICILLMLASAIAKLTGWFILTESTLRQIQSASDASFQFLIASLSAQFGRRFESKKQQIILEKEGQ